MTNSYGPWATLVSAGRNPQLSTFWRRRLTRLAGLSSVGANLTPRGAWALIATALAVGALPTLEGRVVSAEPASPAAKAGTSSADKAGGQAGVTYTGLVSDKSTGKPVAGATVTVLRRVSSRSEPFPKWRRLGETTHQTDQAGHYTFTVPPEQAAEKLLYLEFTVRHPNYVRYYGGYSFDMIRKNETVGDRPFFENLQLVPAEKISGTVVTPDGKPAKGVAVKAFSAPGKHDFEHSSWTDVKTDENGRFQINACKGGEAIFWILPDDYVPSTHVVHAKRGDFGRFVLEKGIVLKGRVLDVDGKPAPKVWVNADLRSGPAKQEIEMPVFDHLGRSALSDDAGQFAMAPLPEGEYDLLVTDAPRSNPSRAVHPLPAVFLQQRIRLEPREPTKSLEVRAVPHVRVEGQFVDSSGKPISGLAPSLWGTADDGAASWWYGETRNDKQGKFVGRAPKGLRVKLSVIDNEHHISRLQVSKDGPLLRGRDAELGVLNGDATDIRIVRYTAPILLVQPVAADTKTAKGLVQSLGLLIKPAQVKIKYAPGVKPEGEYIRDGQPVGDVSFERQSDGRWRTKQLLPDEEFTLIVSAPGYQTNSQTLKLAEGAVKELTVPLQKAADK